MTDRATLFAHVKCSPAGGRSSHPTPAKGRCVPGYAASERMPGGGVWQRKTAAARSAAAPGAAAAATGGAGTACVLAVLSELLAQFLGVCRAHVDLIGGPVKGERNRLRSLDLAVMWKVTHDRHHCLLCHGASPSAGAS